MKTMLVLAGGFGTRLRSVVSDVPKPLAPVNDKAFIAYLIDHWVEQGVKDFIFLLHYEAIQVEALLKEKSCDPKFADTSFKIVIEESPLGTGGSVLNAISMLDVEDSFLVANADTWLGDGVELLCSKPPCALVAVNVPNSERYGAVQCNGSKITQFKEKSISTGQGYVSSGLYHLSEKIFDGFEIGSSFSLEEDVFPKLVADKKLNVVKLDTDFIDIGIPSDYLKFCSWILSGRKNEI